MRFEVESPLIRLSVANERIAICLRTRDRLESSDKGTDSDPLRFLFLVLWGCRERKQERISLGALQELWTRLRKIEQLKFAVNLPMHSQDGALTESVRDWAKKINRDPQIRQLQTVIGQRDRISLDQANGRKKLSPRTPFISVSARSRIGAQVEVFIPGLPLDDLDWDDDLRKYAERKT